MTDSTPSDIPNDPPNARELTRRLVAPDAVHGGVRDPAAGTLAGCERVSRELSRWLGVAGCQALFVRALALARTEHPALGEIRAAGRPDAALDGVAEGIEAHGASAVAAGLESMLVALFALLNRLIGATMTMQLVERAMPNHARDDQTPRS